MLTASDFIQPLFIVDDPQKATSVDAMPGVTRFALPQLADKAKEVYELGIPAVILFPVIDPSLKDNQASEASNPEGLVPKAIQIIKQAQPDLGVITDVALDPYTSHGLDGLVDETGYVLNDATLAVLTEQALMHARSGADMLGPSDMMDGRVGVIRDALEKQNFVNTQIMAYSAKYASAFYGPFRDAVDSSMHLRGASKASFQMDPANGMEALHEVALDLEEGADVVLIKPAGAYMDIIYRVKKQFKRPVFAYQVSGEYAMLKAAAQQGWINEQACVLESLVSLKRAGADAIITYFASDCAQWLQDAKH